MTSIIIAAHNEGAELGHTLDALLADPEVARAEVIVVSNGCTDDTSEIAEVRGVRVIDLPAAGKAEALNIGDRAAASFPRIFLDADIAVPPNAVGALRAALDAGALAVVPRRVLNIDNRPFLVRSYFIINERLPAFHDGLFGRGMIALSAAGRSRFTCFPSMVADDLFLDSVFVYEEKRQVEEVVVVVETPRTTAALVRRLARVRRGNAAMREASKRGMIGAEVRQSDRWSWLRDVVVPDPSLVPAGVIYVALTVAAAVLARRGSLTSLAWGREKPGPEGQ